MNNPASSLPGYEFTARQRARLKFFTLDCGYFVTDGPTLRTDGVMDVTVQHPRSEFSLHYLIATDGASAIAPKEDA